MLLGQEQKYPSKHQKAKPSAVEVIFTLPLLLRIGSHSLYSKWRNDIRILYGFPCVFTVWLPGCAIEYWKRFFGLVDGPKWQDSYLLGGWWPSAFTWMPLSISSKYNIWLLKQDQKLLHKISKILLHLARQAILPLLKLPNSLLSDSSDLIKQQKSLRF